MSSIGCEVPKSFQRSLEKSVKSWLLIAIGVGGLAAGGSVAAAGDDGTVNLDNVLAERWFGTNFSFAGGGWGYGGGGASTGYQDYVSPVPSMPEEQTSSTEGGCAGNPVVLATGNKVEIEVDFAVQGNEGLSLTRTYNHYWKGQGILGAHWLTNHDYSVAYENFEAGACPSNGLFYVCDPKRAHTVLAHRPDGRVLKYVRSGSRYVPEVVGSTTYMEWTADGKLIYHAEELKTETYGNHELLGLGSYITKRQNISGESWTYESLIGSFVNKITHSSGRYIEFIRTDGVFLTGIKDPQGNLHSYTFRREEGKSELLLSHSQASTGLNVTYHYGTGALSGALTGKSYNGVRYSTFAYSLDGRVGSTEHAGGVEKFQFSYSFDGEGGTTTTVTNPLGKSETHTYVDGKPTGTIGSASTYCPATATSISYDPNERVDKETDANGNVTDLDYDEKGRLIKKVEAFGTPLARTTRYEWLADLDALASVTVEGYSRTEYTYTADYRISRERVINLSSNGVANQVRDTTYSYTSHPNGLVATLVRVGPLGSGATLTQTYSSSGDLTSVSNALGHTTTYSIYNGLGQPGKLTDANGAVTEYEYDASGRVLLQRTFPNGSPVETRYVYGASGLLDAKTHSDGSSVYYHYDAAQRLLQEDLTEPGGSFAVKRYTYNAMSKPIKIEIGRDN